MFKQVFASVSEFMYYFCDLPLNVFGIKTKHLKNWEKRSGDLESVSNGADYLRYCLGSRFTQRSSHEIAKYYHMVRLVRESDTYASLLMKSSNVNSRFKISGLENLAKARQEKRPIILLGGHLGSNYSMWIALGFLGYRVCPVARATDRSSATSLARKLYQNTTYKLTDMKWDGHYIYTDSSGHFPLGCFDKIFTNIVGGGGIIYVAIDFPPTLYAGKQQCVSFLGDKTLLPVGIIRKAIKENALLMTVWDTVDFDGKRPMRCIQVMPPLKGESEEEILQNYADRLTELICNEPWQWMGLPIAQQYH